MEVRGGKARARRVPSRNRDGEGGRTVGAGVVAKVLG